MTRDSRSQTAAIPANEACAYRPQAGSCLYRRIFRDATGRLFAGPTRSMRPPTAAIGVAFARMPLSWMGAVSVLGRCDKEPSSCLPNRSFLFCRRCWRSPLAACRRLGRFHSRRPRIKAEEMQSCRAGYPVTPAAKESMRQSGVGPRLRRPATRGRVGSAQPWSTPRSSRGLVPHQLSGAAKRPGAMPRCTVEH